MRKENNKEILLALFVIFLIAAGFLFVFNSTALDYCRQVLYFCTATAFTYYKYILTALFMAGTALAVTKARHLFRFPQGFLFEPIAGEIVDRVKKLAPEASKLKFFSISDYPGMAFTAGFFKPAVFINPDNLNRLSDEEKMAVLLHETAHAHYRDPVIIAFIELITRMLFFVPLMYFIRERVLIYLEKRADIFAAQRLNNELSVASAIVKSARFILNPKAAHAVPAFGATASTIEERVLFLTDRTNFFKLTRLTFYALLTLAVLVLLFLPPSIFADTSCCASSITTICCN